MSAKESYAAFKVLETFSAVSTQVCICGVCMCMYVCVCTCVCVRVCVCVWCVVCACVWCVVCGVCMCVVCGVYVVSCDLGNIYYLLILHMVLGIFYCSRKTFRQYTHP